MTPEGFKVVVTALIGHEDMNDDIAVIQKSPAPLIETFLAQGQKVELSLQAVLNRTCNCTHLDIGLTTSDHHPVGEAGDLINADQTDVGGLAVIASVGDQLGKLLTIHRHSR